jgi:hypothetical protein
MRKVYDGGSSIAMPLNVAIPRFGLPDDTPASLLFSLPYSQAWLNGRARCLSVLEMRVPPRGQRIRIGRTEARACVNCTNNDSDFRGISTYGPRVHDLRSRHEREGRGIFRDDAARLSVVGAESEIPRLRNRKAHGLAIVELKGVADVKLFVELTFDPAGAKNVRLYERNKVNRFRLAVEIRRAKVEAFSFNNRTDQSARRNDLNDFRDTGGRQQVDKDTSVNDRRLVCEQEKSSPICPPMIGQGRGRWD